MGRGRRRSATRPGTETASGYAEHAYTFSVAKKLERLLEDAGAKVVLTRSNDHGVGPCIDERAKIGNDARLGRRGLDPCRRRAARRPRLPRHLPDEDPGPDRRHLLGLAAARGRCCEMPYGKVTGLPRSTYVGDAGLDRRSDLGGLRLSDVPKVFIETANMRNHTDAAKLESKHFRGRVAKGIFAGLRRFLLENAS